MSKFLGVLRQSFFSVKCIISSKPKADQVPHPLWLRILGGSVFWLTVNFLIFGHPKSCCNYPKIWIMRFLHRVWSPKDADWMANSVDPDQTAPRDVGLHCLPRQICPKTSGSLRFFPLNSFMPSFSSMHMFGSKLFFFFLITELPVAECIYGVVWCMVRKMDRHQSAKKFYIWATSWENLF